MVCMYGVCGVNCREVEDHILMKEQLKKFINKYRYLRSNFHYDYNMLTGNFVFDWIKDGLTVFQYLSLVKTQQKWMNSAIKFHDI